MSQMVTKDHREEILTATEAAILRAIIDEPRATHQAIARAAGVSREHVTRLINSEPLRGRIAALQFEVLERAKERARLSSMSAVEVLHEIVLSKTARNADRIKAARAILGFASGQNETDLPQAFDYARHAAIAMIEYAQRVREEKEVENAERRIRGLIEVQGS